MSVQLLDKTRKINKLLHNNNSSKVVFNDICAVLTEILDSNVLVVSKKGKILGVSKSNKVREISELFCLQKRMLIWRHLVFLQMLWKDVRQSSHRSILPGSVSEHCLSTNRMQRILLMILFSVNMVLL